MELTLNRISPENQKNPPASMEGVVFGTVFSNHMFSMVWDDGMGWHDAEIKPYQPLVLDPSTIVLHYGQSSFEGLKACGVQFRNQRVFWYCTCWCRRYRFPKMCGQKAYLLAISLQ